MSEHRVNSCYKAGDIVKEYGITKGLFERMNYGSIIKVTEGNMSSYEGGLLPGKQPEYSLVMRCNKVFSGYEGICIGSDIPELIGSLWGSSLESYTYEILLLK